MKRPFILAGVGLGVSFAAVSPATPQRVSDLPALSRLEPGRWEIRDLDSGATESLCLGDRRALMHLRHRPAQCSWTVIRNDGRDATVTFRCSNGSGRTALRVETARLAQIDSQGILNGLPYALRAEARRAGICR